MFLFTNAPVGNRDTGASAAGRTAAGAGNGTVIDAIRDGAESSGVGFDYLLATAQRESALDPSAKAATSSATGLYQFIEQTWLGVMKNAGPKLGLSAYSDAITARSDGTYTVSDAGARQTILDLRRDPKVASAMAGALTQRNREALGGALGREPTSGDLYAAHVLGAKGAGTLIASAESTPARAAALDLPEAAASNRSLFYEKGGRPRGSAELYALLSTSTAGGKPAVGATSSVPEAATAYTALDGSLRTLFQTDRRQGAVSDGVAKLWQGRTANANTVRPAPTYFPRSDASDQIAETDAQPSSAETSAAETSAADTAPILVPLPPRRPAAFGSSATTPPPPSKLFNLSSLRLRSGP